MRSQTASLRGLPLGVIKPAFKWELPAPDSVAFLSLSAEGTLEKGTG